MGVLAEKKRLVEAKAGGRYSRGENDVRAHLAIWSRRTYVRRGF